MDYKDYYATLGVAKDADGDEIQRAYRKLARKFHPDVNRTDKAEDRFKEINEAYEVLKDPEKREKFDRFGSAWKQAQQTGGPPPGFEDIFSQFGGGAGGARAGGGFSGQGFSSFFDMLFGGAGGPGGAGGTGGGWTSWTPGAGPFTQEGDHHEARLSLSLEEAANGGQRELSLTDPGTGGKRTLRVTIPKGVRSGQKIRLAGQGGSGPRGGRSGDLFLVVEVRRHPRFRLEDRDLHLVLPVSPWEAVLGGTAQVPTLEGDVAVKIPPGSSSGRKIRLRGKGFPGANGSTGDLLAELKIVVPTDLSDRERELFEKLAEESGFDPRR